MVGLLQPQVSSGIVAISPRTVDRVGGHYENGSHRLFVSQFKARWPHFSVRCSSGRRRVTCNRGTSCSQPPRDVSCAYPHETGAGAIVGDVQLKMNETIESIPGRPSRESRVLEPDDFNVTENGSRTRGRTPASDSRMNVKNRSNGARNADSPSLKFFLLRGINRGTA